MLLKLYLLQRTDHKLMDREEWVASTTATRWYESQAWYFGGYQMHAEPSFKVGILLDKGAFEEQRTVTSFLWTKYICYVVFRTRYSCLWLEVYIAQNGEQRERAAESCSQLDT